LRNASSNVFADMASRRPLPWG